MLSTSEHAQIAVGDLTFDVVINGPADGDAVVLLHGFPESAAAWEPVTELLGGSGLRTYAPNQRGYSAGARPEGVDAYRIDHLVADVIGLLDALDLDTAHLVGHDWGATVAWAVAARHPDRVKSLTAVSVPHLAAFGRALREDKDQQERSSYIGLLRMEGKAEQVLLDENARRLRAMFGDAVAPRLVDEHVALLTQPGALTGALNYYRAMSRDLDQTPAVTVPTTYLWSTGDTALGRAGAEMCGEFVDAPYEFIVLEDATHWIPEQRPDELAKAILKRTGTTPD
ncbi:alpha/beta fold hydrolase [Rhodococcus marinonascens]|uniref:alpha/beta fold hydrolase n=1 Tax=Rhodococcus marinonascens TaxID=38311 RepID=UPI00093417C2|nr:alpha/beta hydrolase [Rhodococcus marinonascens]